VEECYTYTKKLWPSAKVKPTPIQINNTKYPQGCSWDGNKLRYNKRRGNKTGAQAICIRNLLADAKKALRLVTKLRADSCSTEDQACLPAMCVSAKLTRAAWKASFNISRAAEFVQPATRAKTENYTGFVTSASLWQGGKLSDNKISKGISNMKKYPGLKSKLLSDASNFGYGRAWAAGWWGHATYFGCAAGQDVCG